MGRSYVIDHCMAALQEDEKQWAFRFYISECLRIVTENTAHLGEKCGYISVSLSDLIEPKKEPKNQKTAEEIIADILADLGEKEVETDERI